MSSDFGSILFGNKNNNYSKWGIEYLDGEDDCYGLNFWRPWNQGGGGWSNYTLVLSNNDRVGIGTKNPQAKLDVNGDIAAKGTLTINKGGVTCLSLGDATGENLFWGTSYIGFNATRNKTTGNWAVDGDNAHNGGGVIYSSVAGDIFFVSIPSTGTGAKSLTDDDIRNNIKLHLSHTGTLKAKHVQVTLANWPDFVFEKDYLLPSLPELEQYITENQRLPNVPSAAEIEADGVNLGEMNAILLQKIEEFTLYILQQEKKISNLQEQINELKKQ
jgi:hypothetical protein